MLLGLYISIVIVLPLALGSYVIFNALPRGRRCPTCGDRTARVRSRGHGMASILLRRNIQHRWCMRCGWTGTARMEPPPVLSEASDWQPGRAPSRDRVDLRSVRVDGHTWRVMVECWSEGGRWRARLVFQEPGGRVCEDAQPMEGASVLEVLSRAYGLPERALAGRLRRSIR